MKKCEKVKGQAGGLAVRRKEPPFTCPKGCGKTFTFGTPWHSYLGHLGLHGLADRYFNGDIAAAQRHLQRNALARQDPAPWNNAWPTYQPVAEVGA